jgi:hypothetical protein
MATCPHCKGHLTDGHRCPRRPALIFLEITAATLAGGLGGILLLAAFDPRGDTNMDGFAFLLGAVAGFGINRFVRA